MSEEIMSADALLSENARLQSALDEARKATAEFDRMRLLACEEVQRLAPLVRESYELKADTIFLRAERDGLKGEARRLKEREATLRARVLEWEDAYDRLAGAFDLHMAIDECQNAMSDYAGVFYDVLLGEMAGERTELRRALEVAMAENEGRVALERRLREECARLEATRATFARSADDWRERAMRAESDAQALRTAIESARFDIHYRHKDSWAWEECPKPTCYPLREALATKHPGAFLLAELTVLRELADDLTRWREAGGDIRDLTYVFETMDKIDAMRGNDQ